MVVPSCERNDEGVCVKGDSLILLRTSVPRLVPLLSQSCEPNALPFACT